MSLKDSIISEVSIFLNPAEFGEELHVNGIKTVGVWDDEFEKSQGISLSGINDVNSFGLITNTRVLYVSEAEIALPIAGQQVEINGEYFEVQSGSYAQDGILTLKLSRAYS